MRLLLCYPRWMLRWHKATAVISQAGAKLLLSCLSVAWLLLWYPRWLLRGHEAIAMVSQVGAKLFLDHCCDILGGR